MKSTVSLPVIVMTGLFASLAAAHPPEADGSHRDTSHHHVDQASLRNWTNTKTGEVVRGVFLAARRVDGAVTVSIERENGDVVVFALADLAEADRQVAQHEIDEVKALNEHALMAAAVAPHQEPPKSDAPSNAKPPQAAPFDLFAPYVKTRWDNRWLYVESDGLPHKPWTYPVMVGIKSWQQQVPLPQAYTGNNAWQIPLKPELADKPISGKTQLYRGAIALAANGVPIFNALNNRGDDTYKVGELDEYGGHSGRGDDYHYHIAPLALQKVVGMDKPIAYALDGFPLYGLFEPTALKGEDKSCPLGGTEKLDELNGHFGVNADGTKGLYHYHASVAYPYINGGVRGKVTVIDDQIDPQPRATPIRQWLQPLRGASITGFKEMGAKSWSLEYTLSGKKHLVNFRIEDGGKYVFDFVEPDGTKKTETYTPRSPQDRPPRDNRQQPPGDRRPPRNPDGAPPAPDQTPTPKAAASGLILSSPALGVNGKLPSEFTCDGAGVSPPLEWSKPPEGTKCYAVTMHHIPGPPRGGGAQPEEKHVYLVLYNIPASTTSLGKALTKNSVTTSQPWSWGVNTVNRRQEYAPPCSKGPGEKVYTLTVYALSKEPAVTPADRRGATMDELLAAIKETTLATATLDVKYERAAK